MSDTAMRVEPVAMEGEEPDAQPAPPLDDVRHAATVLVQLEAWCRRRGLEEAAQLLEPALEWSDRVLTGPGRER